MARVEAGTGARPVKRFDSWYDPGIVTRAGEDILEKLDDWAIKELRRLKLVWSGWGNEASLIDPDWEPFEDSGMGIRSVACLDDRRLRLFFLSLLWRAGSSTVFDGVQVGQDRLEILRRMIIDGDATPQATFPVTLTQIVTQAPWHIVGPRTEHRGWPASDESPEVKVRFFRFFLDGLIIHIDDDEADTVVNRMGNLAVGVADKLHVLTRPYEGSYQEEWIGDRMSEAYRDHFATVEKIFGRQ